MKRNSLTQYDEYPNDMLVYMRNYGPHFNRKLYEFAVSQMSMIVDGKEKKLKPYSKEEVSRMLESNGVKVLNGQLYDCAYVMSMCMADFMGSSIIDEHHVALYVRDVIDDIDAPDGLTFNRWYADMCYCGIAIDWEDVL